MCIPPFPPLFYLFEKDKFTISRSIKRKNVWLISSKASLPEEISICLLVTQHTATLGSKATTSKLHSDNHCFPFHFLKRCQSICSWFFTIESAHWVSLSLSLFFPLPPSFRVIRTDFLLTWKFYLASNQSSDTDIHKFQSKLLIHKILIATRFGKMPCFFQIHKTDETQEWDKWYCLAISNAILI